MRAAYVQLQEKVPKSATICGLKTRSEVCREPISTIHAETSVSCNASGTIVGGHCTLPEHPPVS
jgi:hypothetical protein